MSKTNNILISPLFYKEGVKGSSYLRGFTLIELLIAASIAAILGLAILATFSAGFKTYNKLRNGNLAQADVLLSFEKIEKDLKNTIRFSSIKFTGDKSSISFAGFINHSSSIGRISYFFDTKTGGSLIKTEQPYSYSLLNNSSDGADSKVVAPMKDLSFSYYSFNPATKQYSWNDSFDNVGGVPMQVRIKAVFQEGNEDFEREKTILIPIAG